QAPDPVVPVGLLYGPSGCGKSSLVRAGILPRLDSHITSLIINAKAGDCAEVVLSALRSAIPKLKPSTLAEAIFELRRGTTVGRVLLILDQFEQWLQTWDGDPHCPLVEALRQCDGQRVQVLLMVRDDFWMSAARLMRELDAQIIEGVNATSLDAFTERHAHKVLFACGQAHGVVDAQSPSMENRQFVERAVAELSDHGKVFPVRLALFVQMMHARPWSPETLTTFGGIAGIGVKFLEESFGRLAPARFRSHATAVQQILAALMPGASSNIRGEPCGRSRLMVVSGYGERPADFSEVLMFLDSELRLLTPVEGTGDEVYYQLTHDYLVPSIRQWLDQQRTTTWAGRSEVALELRADMWHRRSEWRALPTPLEFLGILTWTQQRRWTVPQSQMMRAATRAYAIVASLLILIFISATWISRELYGRTQANRVYAQLLVSEMNEIPDLLPIAERWQKWVQPLLASGIASTETDKRARRNLALAALSYDPSHLDAVLSEAVGCSHAELPVFADRLRQVSPMRSGKIVETLSNVLLANHRAPRLRAAALLASLGTEDALQVCQAQIDTVTADLLSSPSDLSGFLPWFQPMGASLQAALQLNLRHEDESRRELAALALKENFNGSASELVELLEQANAAQFRALIELAKGRDDELIPLLRQRLELKRFPPWPARPHSSRKVELALIAQFESAMGWIDEDFAICQWLPIEDVFEVVRQLREAGYRLDRLRPFSTEQGLRVAAIWLRDQRAWDWCLGLSRSELQQRIDTETGLLPQDVAGYLPWVADMEGTPADDEP
ncbi:MAG: hypothetical protein KDA51_18205, partial [Planctomycetales bacterium]|nr:hypothetical protein [Planctomycetales bacterium]